MPNASHDAVAVGITLRGASELVLADTDESSAYPVSDSDESTTCPLSPTPSSSSDSSVEGGPAGDESDDNVKLRARDLKRTREQPAEEDEQEDRRL